MKNFWAIWLSQSKALLTVVAKSFWFLEWSIGWTLQKQVGPFGHTKIASHSEKTKEKAVIKQETKMDKCMVWKRALKLWAVNCIITNISWNRNYWQGRFSITLKLLLLTWTVAATGLLHLNVVLHFWAFNPQLPGWFGVFLTKIHSSSLSLLAPACQGVKENSAWVRDGTDRSKIISFPQSTHTA